MKIPFITFILGSLIDPISSAVGQNNAGQGNCPEGYGRGFNGECVKKFVLPKRKKCADPQLRFGFHETQLDGRLVNYWCEDGWTLVPEEASSSACILGSWNKAVPQCVRPGCEDLKPPFNGEMVYDLDGALALFTCNKDLEIAGEAVLGCDGQHWNASVPACVMTTTPPPSDGSWTSGGQRSALVVTSKSTLFCIFSISMYKLAFH